MCSVFIGIASFECSVLDLCVSFILGSGLVASQILIASRSDVLSNIFEIFVSVVASFVAAAVANSRHFCYSAITSSSIVLILPGWYVATVPRGLFILFELILHTQANMLRCSRAAESIDPVRFGAAYLGCDLFAFPRFRHFYWRPILANLLP
jgi:hypothetical protein